MAPCAVVSGRKRHEIGGHDAADRAFGIIDDLAHGGLALGIEQRQDSFAALFGQAVDERDGVVGIGADDQAADFFIVDQRENIGQQLRRQLFERLGGAARGKQDIEELAHLGGLQPFEQERDVGRMAFADKAQDPVRRCRAQHFADSIVIDRRGFHDGFRG